jgi:2-polyprenyl-3-methyl-5-hydroxy-6-metoxy-1,4-benzoquinol methylase
VTPWNHNIQYHDAVLNAVPEGCRQALDVGCGGGLLTRQLARRCKAAVGIDLDEATLSRAAAAEGPESNIAWVSGDVMTHEFGGPGFDLIAAVATLHHLPLRPALVRFRELLRPGGVLAVVGLYRANTLSDVEWNAVALPASWVLRAARGYSALKAPVCAPRETLAEIRGACAELLPGALVKRQLLFRYTLIWSKP